LHEFLGCELVRRGGAAVHQVGDAEPFVQQLILLGGVEQSGTESGPMQRRPEPVAGAGEVVAGGGGVEAGVDADEQDLQAGRDDIAQALARGSLEFGPIGRA